MTADMTPGRGPCCVGPAPVAVDVSRLDASCRQQLIHLMLHSQAQAQPQAHVCAQPGTSLSAKGWSAHSPDESPDEPLPSADRVHVASPLAHTLPRCFALNDASLDRSLV